MFASRVLETVKKGANARGGIVWLTHRYTHPTKAQKRNDKDALKAVTDVMRVLKKAAEIEKFAAKQSAYSCRHYVYT